MNSTAPVYIARFVGGPADGVTVHMDGPWPLPELITIDGSAGAYRKISQSALTEDLPHVARGAQYEWAPEITESEQRLLDGNR